MVVDKVIPTLFWRSALTNQLVSNTFQAELLIPTCRLPSNLPPCSTSPLYLVRCPADSTPRCRLQRVWDNSLRLFCLGYLCSKTDASSIGLGPHSGGVEVGCWVPLAFCPKLSKSLGPRSAMSPLNCKFRCYAPH